MKSYISDSLSRHSASLQLRSHSYVYAPSVVPCIAPAQVARNIRFHMASYLIKFDQEILKPTGIETLFDIHAFFKTPLMHMGARNNFKHEIRSPEEANNFVHLAELSMDLVYEISKFIEFEIDKDNHHDGH